MFGLILPIHFNSNRFDIKASCKVKIISDKFFYYVFAKGDCVGEIRVFGDFP